MRQMTPSLARGPLAGTGCHQVPPREVPGLGELGRRSVSVRLRGPGWRWSRGVCHPWASGHPSPRVPRGMGPPRRSSPRGKSGRKVCKERDLCYSCGSELVRGEDAVRREPCASGQAGCREGAPGHAGRGAAEPGAPAGPAGDAGRGCGPSGCPHTPAESALQLRGRPARPAAAARAPGRPRAIANGRGGRRTPCSSFSLPLSRCLLQKSPAGR